VYTVDKEFPAVTPAQERDEAGYARAARRINAVRDAIAQACAEVGCACLARRISQHLDELGTVFCPAAGSAQGEQGRSALDLLPILSPLSSALATAGYYDTALECANVAHNFEPVLDMELTRAFLLLVLGDTQEARRIYVEVVNRHGGIPQRAVERLAELAATHSEEEDIAELHAELVRLMQHGA
jgi:hypothetical protein